MGRVWSWLGIGLAVMAVAAGVVFAEDKPEENKYVGDNAKICKMCHKAQVEAWQTWAMAKAWDSLKPEEQQKPECIKCHVTGMGEPGGFVSEKDTPTLVGVQCEVCHGPAGNHMKVPITDKEKRRATMTKPTPELCAKCHTKEGNPHFKEFKSEEAVLKLANHLSPERQKALQEAAAAKPAETPPAGEAPK